MDLNSLLTQWGALAGFAALIAAIINILKTAGLVKDGQAQAWSAALNLIGLAVLLFLNVYQPAVDIVFLDKQAGQIANVLLVVFGYIVQLGGAKLAHSILLGLPIIGKSYSAK
ncbi:MAG: hypothetical protein HPY45_08310 [Anaerolineae bacterium]|nr:hypothetical protein [Anaerolineae bacterium]